jgi:hypothetical protein
MKFANVNGIKTEAGKGLVGMCQGCEQPMIPVCGVKKERHWRHKVDCECDRWWESETEWHRSWKNCFPKDWQEIRNKDSATGEWHISDVKTPQGFFLEFQHSFLKSDERQARNKFYGEKLVWVVDGLTRKNDWLRMEGVLNGSFKILQDISLFRLPISANESSLFSDWCDCNVPVIFDFGVDRPLCCLLPKSSKGHFYVLPLPRQNFVTLHHGGLLGEKNFADLVLYLTMHIFTFENPDLIVKLKKASLQIQPFDQVQASPRPAIQRYFPVIRSRDLNYLLRPRQQLSRRSRRL